MKIYITFSFLKNKLILIKKTVTKFMKCLLTIVHRNYESIENYLFKFEHFRYIDTLEKSHLAYDVKKRQLPYSLDLRFQLISQENKILKYSIIEYAVLIPVNIVFECELRKNVTCSQVGFIYGNIFCCQIWQNCLDIWREFQPGNMTRQF